MKNGSRGGGEVQYPLPVDSIQRTIFSITCVCLADLLQFYYYRHARLKTTLVPNETMVLKLV